MVTSGVDWPHLVFSVGAGLGVLFIGIGILVVCSAIANVLRRLNGTLDEIDKQIGALGAPVAETLGHVGGIADTADSTVARLGGLVGSLETVAAQVVKTTDLAGRAVGPAIVNTGATLTGISAGLRRLITGRPARAEHDAPVAPPPMARSGFTVRNAPLDDVALTHDGIGEEDLLV